MRIDKEELKALSEAANAVTTDVNITMAVGSAPEEVKAVQDFLQHAMPKTILALIAEIERLEKFEDWFVRLDQAEQSLSASFKAERDQLKAENEALIQDAQRYRWLRKKQTFIWLIQDWFPSDAVLTDVNAEIDAAMAKERGQ